MVLVPVLVDVAVEVEVEVAVAVPVPVAVGGAWVAEAEAVGVCEGLGWGAVQPKWPHAIQDESSSLFRPNMPPVKPGAQVQISCVLKALLRGLMAFGKAGTGGPAREVTSVCSRRRLSVSHRSRSPCLWRVGAASCMRLGRSG